MRRSRALTSMLGMSAAAALLAGCGVQTTGVNVASTQPITPSQTPLQTATPTEQGKYAYTLYFVSGTDTLTLTPVVRHSQKPLTDQEILEQLGLGPTVPEARDGYVSRMPVDFGQQISPSGKQAQQYMVQLPVDAFPNIALGQITCTLSTYWQPRNQSNDSVQLVFPDQPVGVGASEWRDCASFGGPSNGDAAGAPSATPYSGSAATGLRAPVTPTTTAG